MRRRLALTSGFAINSFGAESLLDDDGEQLARDLSAWCTRYVAYPLVAMIALRLRRHVATHTQQRHARCRPFSMLGGELRFEEAPARFASVFSKEEEED